MRQFLTSFALLLALTVPAAAGQAPGARKPLDHDAYDSWQRVSSVTLSNDGKILVWQISEQEGDCKLVIRRLETGEELVLDRASGFKMSEAADFGTCLVSAPYAVTRQAKIDKKKDDEMPKDSIACINLKTFEVTRIADASSASTGWDAAPYIFISQKVKDKKDYKNLLVFKTSDSSIDTLKQIVSFEVSRDGRKLAVVTAKDKKDSLSKSSVVLYDYASSDSRVLSEGRKDYSGLSFNDAGDKLVFLSSDEEEKLNGTPSYAVHLAEEIVLKKATRRAPAQTELRVSEIVPQHAAGLPEGWVISKTSGPEFSNASSRLILNLAKYFPAKDTTLVSFETASLDIWNWDSYRLPPMDKARLRKETRTAVINLSSPSEVVTLSANANDRITFAAGAEGDFAISSDADRYKLESLWAVNSKADYSVVDLRDGSRRSIIEGLEGYAYTSPYGKYIVWFNPQDGHWYCRSTAGGDFVNLTAQSGAAFWDEEDDHPLGCYTPYGGPRWVGEDEAVLLQDRYDVWKFSPDGSKAELLTAGLGRRAGVRFSILDLGRKTDPYLYQNITSFPKKGKIYLSCQDEETSENGFAVADIAKCTVSGCFTDKWAFGSPVKAADAATIAYLKGNFRNPMDVYVTSDNWATQTRLSHINPQQDNYIWGDVQMVHWKAYDGTPLKGLLYTPDGLDSTKKYPMMIYFYEKNSEALYNYFQPAPSRSIINIPFYVSRGYVVFVPDIVYKDGHPGESAYNCICSGAEAMCEQFGFVDKARMAIQGQSWGGYQTAYLVTRTDMFAAAGAGAPVGNMTSAYGGIRWESGSSRIPQYEHGQSRVGKTLWDEGGLDLYIENSPVFFAPNVKTPVLIMHNDADGAVPWYQGIEFFMSLRRLGKPAWLLEYNNEAHNLKERRNCKDLSIRLQQFFDHYLQGAPEPAWMKSGIPYERKGSYFGYEAAE